MIIRNEATRYLLMSLLVTEAALAKAYAPSQEPMPPLTAQEIAKLARLSKPELSVLVDMASLQQAMQSMRSVQIVDDNFEYFLVNGAGNSMLAELFNLSANEVKARRRAAEAGRTVSRRRRPPMPAAVMREKIQAQWFAIRKGAEKLAPIIADYRSLHESFPHASLATLYAVVNEFGD